MFYGIKYTKILQDILNTNGGKLAREKINISTSSLSGNIETFSQIKGKWSKNGLTPQDAAITSVALFGMELTKNGQTINERIAGTTLQTALVDYVEINPSARNTCIVLLEKMDSSARECF